MKRPALVGGEPAFPDGLPFFRPAKPSLDRVTRRLEPSYSKGMLTNGALRRELEERAAERLDVPHVVAVASCTAGLMLAAQALADPAGVAVMPSFTFSATAHAAMWAGIRPRFVDCDTATCQIDVDDAASKLDGASLLVGTHVFGAPCQPEALEALARPAGVPVLFDAAHAFGSTRAGRRIGGFGSAEVFSLSPTKVLVAGEGGLIATRDADLAERLRLGVDYGNPGDYDTRFAGLNARMSELHAAVALCSLDELDDHLAIRRDLAARYRSGLEGVPGVAVQTVDPDDVSTYKDLTVIVDQTDFGIGRDALVRALKAEGIDTRPYFWPPVHRQQAYAHLAAETGELPATDWVSSRVVSLPLWRDMPEGSVETVVETVAGIFAHADHIAHQTAGAASVGAVAPEAVR
ncbi:MAG: DegT/DnrJ/EryC1/StrS family aminotransferase [Acidimicrobiales bacterium]